MEGEVRVLREEEDEALADRARGTEDTYILSVYCLEGSSGECKSGRHCARLRRWRGKVDVPHFFSGN